MQSKQQKLSLKNRALRFLSLREHSRLELGRKLARYAEEQDDVEALLDFLEKSRLLSCERFSESLIRRRLGNYGNSRIMAELQTHKLAPELLEQSRAELAQTEVARACAVWQKKFGHLQPDPAGLERGESAVSANTSANFSPAQRAQQIRYLAQRGFSSHAIRVALRGDFDEWE